MISLSSMGLAGREVNVDEANRRVVYHESGENSAFVAVTTSHSSLDGGQGDVSKRDLFSRFDEDASEELVWTPPLSET